MFDGDQALEVKPKAVALLVYLISQRERVVDKQELMERLWPDRFVTEANLTQHVFTLRKGLAETAEEPRFIATAARQGYRFVGEVIESDRQTTTAPAHGAWRQTRRPFWLLWLTGVVAVATVAGVVSWNRRASHEPSLRILSQRPDALLIYAPPGETLTGSFAVSPNGAKLAIVLAGTTPDQSRLWLRSLSSVDSRRLEGTEGAALPFWSPDGRRLGFFAEQRLKTIDLESGTVTTVAEALRGRGGSWNANDVLLFAPDINSPLLAVTAHGGQPTPATDLAGAPSHRFPCFLADGEHFLYLVLREDRDQSEIRWGRLGRSEGGRLMTAGSNAVYMPTGQIFYAHEAVLLAQAFDLVRLEIVGLPQVLSERVGVYGEDGPTGLAAVSVSASGTLAAAESVRPALRLSWRDRAARDLGTVGPPGDYSEFDLSRDGSRAAVIRFDWRKRSSDLVIVDLRTGAQTQVTDDPWPDSSAVWSPTGDRLAFSSLRSGAFRAFVADGAGGYQARPLDPACHVPDSWFPDGNGVLCEHFAAKGEELWKVTLDSSNPATPVVRELGVEPQGRVSPDGAWLAYASDKAGRREIDVLALTEGASTSAVSVGPGDSPRWRRDGRELFFLAGRTVMAVSVDSRREHPFALPHALFEAPLPPRDSLADLPPQFAVSSDGSKFLFSVLSVNEPRAPIHVVANWSRALP